MKEVNQQESCGVRGLGAAFVVAKINAMNRKYNIGCVRAHYPLFYRFIGLVCVDREESNITHDSNIRHLKFFIR